MNKFKNKQDEWIELEDLHYAEIEEHKKNLAKSSVFFTTTFFLKLPDDLKEYIYPFVSFQLTTLTYFERYMEMFKVIGNYMYGFDLKKKKSTFAIAKS